jgi:hypothetical protein
MALSFFLECDGCVVAGKKWKPRVLVLVTGKIKKQGLFFFFFFFVFSPPFPTVLSLSSYRPKGISKIPIKSDFLPFFRENEAFRMKNHNSYLAQKRARLSSSF